MRLQRGHPSIQNLAIHGSYGGLTNRVLKNSGEFPTWRKEEVK
jgi:hypothetical protein